jgi:S-adenosylmethionine/arginine decarboxylase-like enzyme
MQALGRHILVEMYECNEEILNDLNFIEKSMIEATRKEIRFRQ